MKDKSAYDYLAKIYISQKHKRSAFKKKIYISLLVFFVLSLFVGVAIFLLTKFASSKVFSSSESLNLGAGLIKIDYDFTSSDLRGQGYDLELPRLDLRDYKGLEFRARQISQGTKSEDRLFLKIIIENAHRERGEAYIEDINARWQRFRINLGQFRGISELSNLTLLSFLVEAWNVNEKEGALYIEEIKFYK